MASKKTSSTSDTDDSSDSGEVAKAVEEQLPGWKLARPAAHDDAGRNALPRRVAQGASIDDLRRKFLGSADGAHDVDSGDYPALDENVRVFRVEPVGGGPARVAELRGGKIKLVSG
jgi:hypothetical protein